MTERRSWLRWPRRARLALGAALLASSAAVALLPTGAGAADLARFGWWWQPQTGTGVLLPPPPNVPEGGFMVAGQPSGATAMAALRFELADDETSPVLTLRVADGGDQGGETAELAACVTGSAWSPTDGPGRWQDKPSAACEEGSVTGVRAEDGSTWTFALTPLLVDGLLDLLLVPGTVDGAPPGADGSTFQLAFEPVASSDLETEAGRQPSGTPFVLPDFDSGGFAPPGDGAGGFDGSVYTPPPATGAFRPALPPEDQGLTATAPATQRRNPVLPLAPVSESDQGADTTLLGAVVLGLAGVVALGTAREPLPPPRRLGRLAGPAGQAAAAPTVAGLGRFARPRTGPVPRL